MKFRTACVLLGILSLALSLVPPTVAQTTAEPASSLPRLVRFNGTAKDLNGNPQTGVVGITFAFYSEQTGGAALWLETQNVTADSNGHYAALLGSTKTDGLPTDLFTSEQARWVGVQVSGQAEQPRVLLLSVPYALKAADAETLGGKPASAYLLNPQQMEGAPAVAQRNPAAPSKAASNADQSAISTSISGSGTTNYIPRWTSGSSLGNSIIFQSTASKLGIGTTSPTATLDIRESTGMRAIASGNGIAIFGNATVATGTGKGVEGDTNSTSGTGVAGTANATTGSTQGMWGSSFSTSGIGVIGQANATSGNTIGVEGLSASSAGTAGVFNNTGGGKILSGQTSGTEVFSVNKSGVVTGSSYQIGSNLFAFGSYANQNAFLGFAGNSTMTGPANTASGYGALHSNTSGGYNAASGYGAMYSNNSGEGNTASGSYALYFNTTGGGSTANGNYALYSNTTGSGNTAIGSSAMYINSTGGGNTAIGVAALFGNNSTGNTAMGYDALFLNTTGQYNSAVGNSALLYNSGGNGNTASGTYALFSNQIGSYNTANGYFALGENNTGQSNIAVGYMAGYNVTGSNNIEIGSQGNPSDSGAIRIGTTGTQTSAFIAGIYGAHTSMNNAVPVLIDSNGNLGTISSSRRYKEDIQDMGDASSGLLRLRPVTFRYKKPLADGSQPMQYGLIAEEVADVYPDMVAHSADGQIETVKYQLLDPMLLNEVQRQHAEIRDLQERLSKMEAALAAVSRAPESVTTTPSTHQ